MSGRLDTIGQEIRDIPARMRIPASVEHLGTIFTHYLSCIPLSYQEFRRIGALPEGEREEAIRTLFANRTPTDYPHIIIPLLSQIGITLSEDFLNELLQRARIEQNRNTIETIEYHLTLRLAIRNGIVRAQ